MAETPTPRTDAAVARFSYACPPFKPDRIVSATEMERLETDLQHLARVAGEALEEADKQLRLDGYASRSSIRQEIKTALSEIQRIKNQP